MRNVKKKDRRGKCLASLLALCLAVPGIFAPGLECNIVKADEGEEDTWVEKADSQGNGYWYHELEGGGIEITSFTEPSGGEESEGLVEVTVPAVLDGKKVVRIGKEAFHGIGNGYCRERIRKITLPQGVTSIGDSAFRGCGKLEEIILPEGIVHIEHYAFESCSSLRKLTFPDSLTSIEKDIILKCSSLTEVTIPKGVASIAPGALSCDGLTAIHVAGENPSYASQNGVLYNKAGNVLLCCPGGVGKDFTIPENTEEIGDYAFVGCTELTNITITGNVERIGEWAFSTLPLAQVEIPGNVKTIGEYAFSFCYGLEKIILEEGIEAIGSSAFLLSSISSVGADAENITIPASVTSLGNDIFGGCERLRAIQVAEGNKNYSSEDGILYDKEKAALLFCPIAKVKPGEVRIIVPDTVQSIEEDAFDHSSGYTKGVTLVCYKGSPAQNYAEEHGMLFEASREAYTFTITFDANGGTDAGGASLAITEGKTIRGMGLELPAANRAGYEFLGWYTDKAGGAEVTAETRFTGDTTVYAHWEQQSPEDGPTQQPTQPGGSTQQPTQPGGPTQQPTQPGGSTQQGQTVKYTVTFHKNGGSKVSKASITVEKGKKIGKLPTAQRKGYAFQGWYTAKKGGAKITSSMKVTQNQTVYAQWKKVAKPKKAGKPSLKSKKSGQLTVSYGKVSGAKGYEICYSTKKNFKGDRKLTVSKTKATINKLKKKTVYYVKIRAYKLDSAGGKVYGGYGAVRKLKTK